MRFSVALPDGATTPVWEDEAALEALDRLVARAEEAGHFVFLLDLDDLERSAWYRTARSRQQTRLALLREAAIAASWMRRGDGHVIQDAAGATRALRIACSPLVILVENRLRDGALVDAAVHLYASGELLSLWTEPPSPPAITVEHGGGLGELPALIRRHLSEAEEADLLPRLIALADSDRKSGQETISGKAEAVRKLCEEHGLTAVILSKRTAESYLPDAWWKEARKLDEQNPAWTDAMDTLLKMSADQRDFVDMDASGKGWKQIPKGIEPDRPYHLERFAAHVRSLDEAGRPAWRADLDRRDAARDLLDLIGHIEEER